MQMLRNARSLLSLLFAVLTALLPGRVWLPPEETSMIYQSETYALAYDTQAGTFSVMQNGRTLFADACCEYDRDGVTVSSRQYSVFEISEASADGETEITVRMQGEGLWNLTQCFCFAPGRAWFTTRVTLESPDGAATNYIAPLVITQRKLQTLCPRWTNILVVPSDNDGWVQFAVKRLDEPTVSYEVGALFTPDHGSGLILGSLEHHQWKSAVRTAGSRTKLEELRLYCGATDPRHGPEPHGTVRGQAVTSPLMFIGVFDNWKDGMNTFARANTAIQPKRRAVCDSVPFGWNSWGSVQSDLNYETAVQTSDYIKEQLQPAWAAAGAETVYVNLDSWWDMLSDMQLRQFVDHCHANGQKAGIYSAPFVMWWDDYGMSVNAVPGTDGRVTYQEIRLRKSDGSFYGNEVDGCLPLDVTHPATKLHAQHQIDRFKAAGFDYVKLDFLVHASFEGDFYDPAIQTGTGAYNYAMTWLTEMLGDEIFINLAMSPTFPYQYANGRRLACDAFYGIGDTEYTLNAVTYGFWEQELYDYTDPDHIVVWGRDGGAGEAEARSRVTSGVISGTSFLTGDNFVQPAGDADAAFARYARLLTQTEVLAVAQTGQIFTPVITDVSNRTANLYKLELEGKTYLAVFNFSDRPRVFTADTGFARFTGKELWTGRAARGARLLTVSLPARDAALFELTEG